jgi:hypothetical protein
VGQNLEVNGFWHKCQSFSENGTVAYTQGLDCQKYPALIAEI